MKSQQNPLYLTIHGHFYQPPRENPWTGSIELQESSMPDHDWNDRIAKQCYTPNSASRILGEYGKIKKIVNNYEYMSFNFGPTLMSWIRVHAPETYMKIIEADQKSAKRLDGHGNAIAQVYNHIIMPLASRRDRLTQIKWGKADFKFHFNREPEAMWMAETAINTETIVDLIQEKIKYVILSPTQADKFRDLKEDVIDDSGDWQGCENTDIDTSKAYRIFPRDEKGKLICDGHLDVFFYNAELSSAVGFEHLLRDAKVFTKRIVDTFDKKKKEPQLISIGTDGESYGHHEPYGDMCAAYIFSELATENNIVPVNYAWYLENFPPVHEVMLKNTHGEGSAWSCAHGVGRWYRDCGCSTGGPASWNQKWRGPLRKAFDVIHQKSDEIFERELNKIDSIKDPWKVRNDYIKVLVVNEDLKLRNKFLQEICDENLFETQSKMLLRLLEAQKFSLFSYTSCGWFFNDILGLEPVQNMKYALRAMELIEPWIEDYSAFEASVMKELAVAKANEDNRNGAEVFMDEAIVYPPTIVKVAAGYALAEYLEFNSTALDFGNYIGEIKSELPACYQVNLVNKETSESNEFSMMVHQGLDAKITILVLGGEIDEECRPETNNLEFMKAIVKKSDNAYLCGAEDLISDSRTMIVEQVAYKASPSVGNYIKSFLSDNNLTADFMLVGREVLGDSLYIMMSLEEELRLKEMLKKVLKTPNIDLLVDCKKTFKRLDDQGIKPSFIRTSAKFKIRIKELIKDCLRNPNPSNVLDTTELITLADLLRLDIQRNELENMVYQEYLEYKNDPDNLRSKRLRPLFGWLNFEML